MKTYKEFWPFYVSQHLHPVSRRLHFIGTGLTFVFLVLAIALKCWLFLLAIPICGYGFAWVGHFVFEKNRPATFKYPVWSLISDYKMFFLTLLGRMESEVQKARHNGA